MGFLWWGKNKEEPYYDRNGRPLSGWDCCDSAALFARRNGGEAQLILAQPDEEGDGHVTAVIYDEETGWYYRSGPGGASIPITEDSYRELLDNARCDPFNIPRNWQNLSREDLAQKIRWNTP